MGTLESLAAHGDPSESPKSPLAFYLIESVGIIELPELFTITERLRSFIRHGAARCFDRDQTLVNFLDHRRYVLITTDLKIPVLRAPTNPSSNFRINEAFTEVYGTPKKADCFRSRVSRAIAR